jgi:hypothetical protein
MTRIIDQLRLPQQTANSLQDWLFLSPELFCLEKKCSLMDRLSRGKFLKSSAGFEAYPPEKSDREHALAPMALLRSC